MRRDLASTTTAEQENPACPSCGRDRAIYLGSFPELHEDAWGCLACGREFNLIPDWIGEDPMPKANRPPDVFVDCGVCDGNGWRPGGAGESPHDCGCCGGAGRIKR